MIRSQKKNQFNLGTHIKSYFERTDGNADDLELR